MRHNTSHILKERKKESAAYLQKRTKTLWVEPPIVALEGELVCVAALVDGQIESPFLF
jgi:hypothetical protein